VSNRQEKVLKPILDQDNWKLLIAGSWKMLADLDQRLIFTPEIATTNLRPDIVLWSGSACIVQLEDADEEETVVCSSGH